MITRKRITKRKKVTKKPELQSWQAHPLANHGEVNKQLIIGVVSIVAIVILVSLLFFAKQFVGQAYYIPGEGNAGIEELAPQAIDTSFPVVVKADIGTKETVAIAFELSFPKEVKCNNIENLIGWDNTEGLVLNTFTCANNKVTFEYATLNTDLAKTGEFNIAKIWLTSPLAGTYTLDFTNFDSFNLETRNDIITDAADAELEIIVPTKEECFDPDNTYTPNFNNGVGEFNPSSLLTKTEVSGIGSSGEFETKSDLCSGESLIEMYCKDETSFTWNGHTCPEGTTCQEGACKTPEVEDCTNGIDDDGDTYIDCVDEDCAGLSCGTGCQCSTDLTAIQGKASGIKIETACEDTLDNDGDTLIDTDDSDCVTPAVCSPENLELCSEAECTTFSGIMVGDLCTLPVTVTCSSTNLELCTTVAQCESVNGVIVDSLCTLSVTETCSADNLELCTATTCPENGGTWDNEECTFVDVCSTENPELCITEPTCTEVGGTWDTTEETCTVTPIIPTVSAIKVELVDSTGAVMSTTDKLVEGDTYTVKVSVEPEAALVGHLLIVTTNYGAEQKAQIFETKPTLAVGNVETLEFTHQVSESAGSLNIAVNLWKNWPSIEEAFDYLLEPVEVSYEIQ